MSEERGAGSWEQGARGNKSPAPLPTPSSHLSSPPRPPPISIEDEDRVGLAFLAMAISITSGIGLIAVALWVVSTLLADMPASDTPIIDGAPFYVLVGGTLLGIVVAGLATWVLLAPVRSTYRRGGLSFVSAFATAAGMLVTMPVNQLAGRTGLVGLVVFCGLVALLLSRRLSSEHDSS